MTAMPIREPAQLAELTAPQLRLRLDEALQIYVTAMHYPPGTARHRSPMWLEHMLRDGWLCMAAFDADALVGIGTGADALVAACALLQIENKKALRLHQSLG